MKKITFLLAVLLSPLAIFADGWDDALYRQIESRIVAPTFKEQTFNITKYGASPNATAAKNQQAINKAILTCSLKGGGKVIVPAGTYMTGAITLKSNVNLVLEKDATLKFAFEPELYPLVRTRYEGLDCYNYSPCIYSYDAKNIGITGEGTIDGNGSKYTFWQWTGEEHYGYNPEKAKENCRYPAEGETLGWRARLQQMCEDNTPIDQRKFGMGKGLRMQLVNIVNSENIIIDGVTMINSPFWVMHPLFSKNITVRNVKVYNEGPNGDGCDPESCEDVLIENCVFHTGDDCIAIKSGRNADGRRDGRPSKNIIVRGCVMEDGHGGVVIGSEIAAGCSNVFVENCKMDSPKLDRILRIKTNSCRGGITENVFMRNVEVGQCKEAVMRINLNYQPNEAAERGHNPTVRNVWMENVTCQKSKYGVLLNGLEDASQIYNINIKNCHFNGVQDAPVMRTGLSHDLHFENLYVNDKLVLIEKPYKTYSEWLTYSEMKRVPESYMLDFATQPKWSYVMGIELEAMLDTYLAHGGDAIKDYCQAYTDKMIDANGNILTYKIEDYNLDQIRTGHFVARMYELYPEAKNKTALETLMLQLKKQPRTKEGVYWHKAIYSYQVWLDGIFMGLPFHALTANMFLKDKQAKKIYDDAVNQIKKTYERTYDPTTGLNRHAWDETREMFWSDKETGLSQHCWGRAQGWYTMALIELLDALPENYARRQEVIDLVQKDLAAVVKWQDKETGLWYQVMDAPGREGNYLESTCSSMFAYALLKAARKGYVGEEFCEAGVKAYKGIINNFIEVNPDKTISLTKCCEVAGLGPGVSAKVLKAAPKVKENKRRDGSFNYYISEPVRANDAKGVGPFIWASLEMEQMGWNTNSEY
ncbi:MAG: glycoside hydrolase family 88 protein [Prevotella sp.]|nr:glycoside hydrolase family 88 protein [Prevotella sp.]